MYLAVRSVRIHTAQFAKAVALSQRLVAHMTSDHDTTIRASMNVAGNVNTLAFSSRWESLGDYQRLLEALQTDTKYQQMLDDAGEFTVAGTEVANLLKFLRPSGIPSNFTSVIQANIRQDPMEATAWALEVAEYVSDLTGTPVGVANTVVGDRGRLSWMSAIQNLDEYQSIGETLEQDPGYLGLIKRAQGLFTDSGYRASLWRTVA